MVIDKQAVNSLLVFSCTTLWQATSGTSHCTTEVLPASIYLLRFVTRDHWLFKRSIFIAY